MNCMEAGFETLLRGIRNTPFFLTCRREECLGDAAKVSGFLVFKTASLFTNHCKSGNYSVAFSPRPRLER